MTTMMRYLCSLLLTLMLCVSQSASAGTARNDGCLPAEKPRQTEGLVLPVNHDQQSPLATLRSGHDGYRIAGSRSYRPVPPHAPGGSRTEYSDDSRDGTKGYANVGIRVVRTDN